MPRRAIGIFIFAVLILSGCKKEDVPQKSYYFTFKVKMSKRITEPTIVNGFYGTMTNLNGKRKKKKDSVDANAKPIAQNTILLFDSQYLDQIKEIGAEKNGKTLYSLKKLKKLKIKPKFIIVPNKFGFFQFDPGNKAFIPLIEIKGNNGYYPMGLQILPELSSELRMLNVAID